eukprot:GHVH01007383.1.p1 GENE.GHVH01007383.1~~GHVH01007383.1.p1  ORF type:complete len:526 (-),score=69.63 GHVH01007383.1:236-1813(-)
MERLRRFEMMAAANATKKRKEKTRKIVSNTTAVEENADSSTTAETPMSVLPPPKSEQPETPCVSVQQKADSPIERESCFNEAMDIGQLFKTKSSEVEKSAVKRFSDLDKTRQLFHGKAIIQRKPDSVIDMNLDPPPPCIPPLVNNVECPDEQSSSDCHSDMWTDSHPSKKKQRKKRDVETQAIVDARRQEAALLEKQFELKYMNHKRKDAVKASERHHEPSRMQSIPPFFNQKSYYSCMQQEFRQLQPDRMHPDAQMTALNQFNPNIQSLVNRNYRNMNNIKTSDDRQINNQMSESVKQQPRNSYLQYARYNQSCNLSSPPHDAKLEELIQLTKERISELIPRASVPMQRFIHQKQEMMKQEMMKQEMMKQEMMKQQLYSTRYNKQGPLPTSGGIENPTPIKLARSAQNGTLMLNPYAAACPTQADLHASEYYKLSRPKIEANGQPPPNMYNRIPQEGYYRRPMGMMRPPLPPPLPPPPPLLPKEIQNYRMHTPMMPQSLLSSTSALGPYPCNGIRSSTHSVAPI